MENNPIPQRQRARRAERYAQPPAVEEQQQPVVYQQAPQPIQQPMYPQPAQQPVYPQQRQYPPTQPMQQQAMPPAQALYRQQLLEGQARQPQYAARQSMQAQQSMQRPAARAPRSLQQTQVNTGWNTPTLEPRPAAAPDRIQRRQPPKEALREEAAAKPRKLPGWLVTTLSLMLVCVMALAAAFSLMKAWLKTNEEERIAAYQAILNNYHVTEGTGGELRVTYQDYIERYAGEYNLQPAFVTAIIRNESSFRTNAESSAGARGLMQMMPDTAEWIAGKLDDDSYTFDRMYDAETNIRYGCWYLGYLSDLFRGDPVLISAAYHAGQGNVRGWLGNREISADGMTIPIDKLPIAETRQYAGRVTQAYGIYQTLLYTDDAPPAVQSYDDRVAADGLLSAVR